MAAAERRYSRVSRCMWRDEKFQSLTRVKPSGQSLWIYLLTGPHCTSIPGLFVLGEAALAEELGWPIASTQNAIMELERAKMLVRDKNTRLMWLPKAMIHNKPESPNVVTGWKRSWLELPKCPTLNAAYEILREWCASLGDAYLRSFQTAVGDAPPQPSTNPDGYTSSKRASKASVKGDADASVDTSSKVPPIPEQEQEHEQLNPREHADAPAREARTPERVESNQNEPAKSAERPAYLALIATIADAADGKFDGLGVGSVLQQAFGATLQNLSVDDATLRRMGELAPHPERIWPTAKGLTKGFVSLGWVMGKRDEHGTYNAPWVLPWVTAARESLAAEAQRAARIAAPAVPAAPLPMLTAAQFAAAKSSPSAPSFLRPVSAPNG